MGLYCGDLRFGLYRQVWRVRSRVEVRWLLVARGEHHRLLDELQGVRTFTVSENSVLTPRRQSRRADRPQCRSFCRHPLPTRLLDVRAGGALAYVHDHACRHSLIPPGDARARGRCGTR